MKRFIVCMAQFMLLSVMTAFAQERISVLNDQLVFYVPDRTVKELTIREFVTYEEYKNYYYPNKISFGFTIYNASNLKLNDGFSPGGEALSIGMMELVRNNRLTQNDFLSLLRSTPNDFVYVNNWKLFETHGDKIQSTHVFYKYNGVTVGDMFYMDTSEGVSSPFLYGHMIYLVVGDNIVNIKIGMHDETRILPPRMPEYFYRVNSSNPLNPPEYRWRDYRESRGVLYERLTLADYRGLPEEFQRLRETFEMVLNTITINGYERNEFYATETALRLRVGTGTSSDTIVIMPEGTRVRLLEEGGVQIIDGIAAKWVRVETDDGVQGWCFSGYLKPWLSE